MIVMRYVPGFAFRLEDEIREMVRLREGMTPDGLSSAAMDRAVATLKLYKRYCDSSEVDEVVATATSAVRDGANGPAFVERVKREVGFDLQVLDGEQEARFGVIGALNNVPMDAGFVIDIGGGSAQISEVDEGRFVRGAALPLGALRLTEAFVTDDPLPKADRDRLEVHIESQLDSIPWLKRGKDIALAGIGGTIRNLGYVDMARRAFPLPTAHGLNVTRKSLNRIIKELAGMKLEKRQSVAGLNADRADIILPGLLVLRGVMTRLGVKHVAISAYGIREGIFLEKFWGHLPYPVIPDVRRFGVLNLARNYGYDKPHANHVRYLALRLFDQLQPLHGYGVAERQLLDAAAILHDIGTVIGYKGHHRHSATLIANNGLPGFEPRELALVALAALYHRKGTPVAGEYKGILGRGDEERLRIIAAILRLAEFLERGRNAVVSDVIAAWTPEELTISLVAEAYPAVELWDAERKAAPLLQEVFARDVVLNSLATPRTEPTSVVDGLSDSLGAYQTDDAQNEPEGLDNEG